MSEKDWSKNLWEFLDQLVSKMWKGDPSSEKSLTDWRICFHDLVEEYQEKEKAGHHEGSLHKTRRLIYGAVNELMVRKDKDWICVYLQKFRPDQAVVP